MLDFFFGCKNCFCLGIFLLRMGNIPALETSIPQRFWQSSIWQVGPVKYTCRRAYSKCRGLCTSRADSFLADDGIDKITIPRMCLVERGLGLPRGFLLAHASCLILIALTFPLGTLAKGKSRSRPRPDTDRQIDSHACNTPIILKIAGVKQTSTIYT